VFVDESYEQVGKVFHGPQSVGELLPIKILRVVSIISHAPKTIIKPVIAYVIAFLPSSWRLEDSAVKTKNPP